MITARSRAQRAGLHRLRSQVLIREIPNEFNLDEQMKSLF